MTLAGGVLPFDLVVEARGKRLLHLRLNCLRFPDFYPEIFPPYFFYSCAQQNIGLSFQNQLEKNLGYLLIVNFFPFLVFLNASL